VAQEILTEDRVTLRINVTAMLQVTDPERLVQRVPALEPLVHRQVQLAVRDAVGGRTLDALLKARQEVDTGLARTVADRLGNIGVEIADVRIKDVILPGDMREMLNRVVEAEKAAEANLIRRREETAATRALLNTARLMENHPALMRLKELEALERLTDKVGRIDVHQTAQGAGLPALIDTLMGARTDADRQAQ
jgi:regulator of protease activity HflC (stomatin/prohibitin superfamily)